MTTEYSLINAWKTCKFSNFEMQFPWMWHKINVIALTSHFEDENAFISNECVPSQRQIRTSTGSTYSEYWWFGAEGSASISPVTLRWEAGGFLMPLLCVGPSVKKCHRHVKTSRHVWWANWLVNAHNIVFADSSEVCSGTWYCHWIPHKQTGQQTSTPRPCTLDWSSVHL